MSIQYRYSNRGIVAVISNMHKGKPKLYIRGISPAGTIKLYDPNKDEIELYEEVLNYTEFKMIKNKLKLRKLDIKQEVNELSKEDIIDNDYKVQINKMKRKEVEGVITRLRNQKINSNIDYINNVIVKIDEVNK